MTDGDVRPMRTVISSIRRKLSDKAENPAHLFTEPRVGYRMPRGRSRESETPMARRSLRSSVPTRHTTGIERPRCVDRLPSHISKMVVSTVSGGGPELTVGRTIFELWLVSL